MVRLKLTAWDSRNVDATGHGRSEQRPFAKRALERRGDALARELALVAQKSHDAVDVGLRLSHAERVGDIRLQKDAADVVDDREVAERVADLGRHLLDPPVLPDQTQRLLRTDAANAAREVGADEDREVDELFARDPPAGEQRREVEHLRHDRAERTLTWQ